MIDDTGLDLSVFYVFKTPEHWKAFDKFLDDCEEKEKSQDNAVESDSE